LVLPDVSAALERAGLLTAGPVLLFHATDSTAAAAIEGSGLMHGDANGQVWLASSEEIAGLEHAAGATETADGGKPEIDALLEVVVDAEWLYWEETRPADGGEVELFYLLDDGRGCEVEVRANRHWTPGGRAPEPSGEAD
jgi:hypothetical protein